MDPNKVPDMTLPVRQDPPAAVVVPGIQPPPRTHQSSNTIVIKLGWSVNRSTRE